jgi:hypothetical protein
VRGVSIGRIHRMTLSCSACPIVPCLGRAAKPPGRPLLKLVTGLPFPERLLRRNGNQHARGRPPHGLWPLQRGQHYQRGQVWSPRTQCRSNRWSQLLPQWTQVTVVQQRATRDIESKMLCGLDAGQSVTILDTVLALLSKFAHCNYATTLSQ